MTWSLMIASGCISQNYHKCSTSTTRHDLVQPFTAAPFALTTLLQTVRKFLAMFLATACARELRSKRLKRSRYATLPNTGTPCAKSRRSRARSCLRTQPHIFSTGFRSGERGGISMRSMRTQKTLVVTDDLPRPALLQRVDGFQRINQATIIHGV